MDEGFGEALCYLAIIDGLEELENGKLMVTGLAGSKCMTFWKGREYIVWHYFNCR
jgi:hypothetical protein